MVDDYFGPKLTEAEVRSLGSLALAHVGDAVFELMVRLYVCSSQGKTSTKLHREAVTLVNAHAQADAIRRILPLLTEEETEVYKRGRNTKVNYVPKHADVGDYHAATGLEALFGWLYLMERKERLNALFGAIMEGYHAA